MSRKRFLLLLIFCAALFLGLQRGYIMIRDRHEELLNNKINGGVAAWVINLITPSEQVVMDDGMMNGKVDISKGCEGFEVMILLVSVMAVYPMRLRHKLTGIVLGCILVYGLNIIRIVSLYYLYMYASDIFELFHLLVWQAIIILIAWVYFMIWIDRPGATPPARGSASSAG